MFFVVTRHMFKTNVHEGGRYWASTVRAVKFTDFHGTVRAGHATGDVYAGTWSRGCSHRMTADCTAEHHYSSVGVDPVPSVFWIGRAVRRLVSGTGAQRHHRCSQLNSPVSLWLSSYSKYVSTWLGFAHLASWAVCTHQICGHAFSCRWRPGHQNSAASALYGAALRYTCRTPRYSIL